MRVSTRTCIRFWQRSKRNLRSFSCMGESGGHAMYARDTMRPPPPQHSPTRARKTQRTPRVFTRPHTSCTSKNARSAASHAWARARVPHTAPHESIHVRTHLKIRGAQLLKHGRVSGDTRNARAQTKHSIARARAPTAPPLRFERTTAQHVSPSLPRSATSTRTNSARRARHATHRECVAQNLMRCCAAPPPHHVRGR